MSKFTEWLTGANYVPPKTRVVACRGRTRIRQEIKRAEKLGYSLVDQNRSTTGKTTLFFELEA